MCIRSIKFCDDIRGIKVAGETMRQSRVKTLKYLESAYPEYKSCIEISTAIGYARSTIHTQLSQMSAEGSVQKKSGAANGPKQQPSYPSDPMPWLRLEKVTGWRLNK